MSDLIGRTLGAYRIVEQLGVGGMATVFKAYHATMDRYVAVKVLPQHLARDPNFRARFEREARTIARLEHRHILPVHEYGESDGIPYLVMRYTDGGTLSDLIASGQVSLEHGAELVAQVGDALGYAHRQGVVHRDIKPANVLIGRDGAALLSDFGIAKMYEDTMHLTGEGVMIGTPFYMAPEQVQGRPADARSDIYALGVILYEVLAGRRPFVAETPLAVALMHVHEPLPPPRALRPDLPEVFERIILRAMAKNPEDRFQTADEMAAAIRSALVELRGATLTAPQEEARRGATPSTPPPVPPTPQPPLIEPAPATPAPRAAPTMLLPETGQQPVPATSRRAPPWIWIGGAVAALAIITVALLVMRPATLPSSGPPTAAPGATPAPQQPVAALAPGPTVPPRPGVRSLGNPSEIRAMATWGDTVWAITGGGLLRIDGAGNLRVFTIADGLPFNNGNTITIAPEGTLWIGGYAAIARVRPVADGLGDVQFFGWDAGLDIGEIYRITLDADGAVFASGSDGIRQLEGARWEAPAFARDPDDPAFSSLYPSITDILRSDTQLWLSLHGGVLRYDGQRWTRYSAEQGIGDKPVYRLLRDRRSGVLWGITDQGLLRYDQSADRFDPVVVLDPEFSWRQLLQMSDDSLWAVGYSALATSNDGGATWVEVRLPENLLGGSLTSIAQDAAGRVWLGAEGGIALRDPDRWTRLPLPPGLPMSNPGRIFPAPDGRLWVTPNYGGPIGIIDQQSGAIEPFPPLEGARVFSIAFDGDTIWAGTGDGLFRIRGNARLRFGVEDGLPSNEIRALLLDGETLWIGGAGSLARFDLATQRVAEIFPEFDGSFVSVLTRMPDGAIWAGGHREGDNGFGILGRWEGGVWEFFRQGDLPDAEDEVNVVAIAPARDDGIWLLTYDRGVYRRIDGGWRRFREEEGAPPSGVQALSIQPNAVLVGGTYGNAVFRFNADGWSRLEVPGLNAPVNDIYRSEDQALWLATDDGLLRFEER